MLACVSIIRAKVGFYAEFRRGDNMTNYERIKAMSVEEMVELLGGICPYALDPMSEKQRAIGVHKCLSGISCDNCHLDWLNSEVEE